MAELFCYGQLDGQGLLFCPCAALENVPSAARQRLFRRRLVEEREAGLSFARQLPSLSPRSIHQSVSLTP
jgi:hypothetical protein